MNFKAKYVNEDGVSYSKLLGGKGKKYDRFRERILNMGLTPEESFKVAHIKSCKEALKTLGRYRTPLSGKTFENGLGYHQVRRRMRLMGMTFKEACTTPKKPSGRPIHYINGVSVLSMVGTRAYVRYCRLRQKGFSEQDALKECQKQNFRKTPEEILKIEDKAVRRLAAERWRRGWSIEDAINKPKITREEALGLAKEKSSWSKMLKRKKRGETK